MLLRKRYGMAMAQFVTESLVIGLLIQRAPGEKNVSEKTVSSKSSGFLPSLSSKGGGGFLPSFLHIDAIGGTIVENSEMKKSEKSMSSLTQINTRKSVDKLEAYAKNENYGDKLKAYTTNSDHHTTLQPLLQPLILSNERETVKISTNPSSSLSNVVLEYPYSTTSSSDFELIDTKDKVNKMKVNQMNVPMGGGILAGGIMMGSRRKYLHKIFDRTKKAIYNGGYQIFTKQDTNGKEFVVGEHDDDDSNSKGVKKNVDLVKKHREISKFPENGKRGEAVFTSSLYPLQNTFESIWKYASQPDEPFAEELKMTFTSEHPLERTLKEMNGNNSESNYCLFNMSDLDFRTEDNGMNGLVVMGTTMSSTRKPKTPNLAVGGEIRGGKGPGREEDLYRTTDMNVYINTKNMKSTVVGDDLQSHLEKLDKKLKYNDPTYYNLSRSSGRVKGNNKHLNSMKGDEAAEGWSLIITPHVTQFRHPGWTKRENNEEENNGTSSSYTNIIKDQASSFEPLLTDQVRTFSVLTVPAGVGLSSINDDDRAINRSHYKAYYVYQDDYTEAWEKRNDWDDADSDKITEETTSFVQTNKKIERNKAADQTKNSKNESAKDESANGNQKARQEDVDANQIKGVIVVWEDERKNPTQQFSKNTQADKSSDKHADVDYEEAQNSNDRWFMFIAKEDFSKYWDLHNFGADGLPGPQSMKNAWSASSATPVNSWWESWSSSPTVWLEKDTEKPSLEKQKGSGKVPETHNMDRQIGEKRNQNRIAGSLLRRQNRRKDQQQEESMMEKEKVSKMGVGMEKLDEKKKRGTKWNPGMMWNEWITPSSNTLPQDEWNNNPAWAWGGSSNYNIPNSSSTSSTTNNLSVKTRKLDFEFWGGDTTYLQPEKFVQIDPNWEEPKIWGYSRNSVKGPTRLCNVADYLNDTPTEAQKNYEDDVASGEGVLNKDAWTTGTTTSNIISTTRDPKILKAIKQHKDECRILWSIRKLPMVREWDLYKKFYSALYVATVQEQKSKLIIPVIGGTRAGGQPVEHIAHIWKKVLMDFIQNEKRNKVEKTLLQEGQPVTTSTNTSTSSATPATTTSSALEEVIFATGTSSGGGGVIDEGELKTGGGSPRTMPSRSMDWSQGTTNQWGSPGNVGSWETGWAQSNAWTELKKDVQGHKSKKANEEVKDQFQHCKEKIEKKSECCFAYPEPTAKDFVIHDNCEIWKQHQKTPLGNLAVKRVTAADNCPKTLKDAQNVVSDKRTLDEIEKEKESKFDQANYKECQAKVDTDGICCISGYGSYEVLPDCSHWFEDEKARAKGIRIQSHQPKMVINRDSCPKTRVERANFKDMGLAKYPNAGKIGTAGEGIDTSGEASSCNGKDKKNNAEKVIDSGSNSFAQSTLPVRLGIRQEDAARHVEQHLDLDMKIKTYVQAIIEGVKENSTGITSTNGNGTEATHDNSGTFNMDHERAKFTRGIEFWAKVLRDERSKR